MASGFSHWYRLNGDGHLGLIQGKWVGGLGLNKTWYWASPFSLFLGVLGWTNGPLAFDLGELKALGVWT